MKSLPYKLNCRCNRADGEAKRCEATHGERRADEQLATGHGLGYIAY